MRHFVLILLAFSPPNALAAPAAVPKPAPIAPAPYSLPGSTITAPTAAPKPANTSAQVAMQRPCTQQSLDLGIGELQLVPETAGGTNVQLDTFGTHEYTRCFKSAIGDILLGYGMNLGYAHGPLEHGAFNFVSALFTYSLCAVSQEGFHLCGDIGPEVVSFSFAGTNDQLGALSYGLSMVQNVGAGFGLGVAVALADYINPAAAWKELDTLSLRGVINWTWTTSR